MNNPMNYKVPVFHFLESKTNYGRKLNMYYRHVSNEEAKKIVKKGAVIDGFIFAIIAALIAVIFVGTIEDNQMISDFVIWIMFFLSFIIMSIYSFCKPSIIEKKDQALDNPNSKIYKKNQARLESSRKYILKRSSKHKNLRHILSRKNYRKVMEGYSKLGMNESEAESDFNEGKVYIANSSTFSISSKAFASTREEYVVSINSIVWVFTGYEKYYTSNVMSPLVRLHHLFIVFEDGCVSNVSCPEELCSLITEDIVNYGNCVTTGYSDEMLQLYLSAPEKFRYAVKPSESIQYQPVNLTLRPLPLTIYYYPEESCDH